MKKLLCVMFLYPFIMSAQGTAGIRFEQGVSWEQIKEQASEEHKYIFLDLYATWCGPCKMMDKYVYVNDTVGEEMAKKFISVKVQMDSTDRDNHTVRSWYSAAQELGKEYHIDGFPTFLFLTDDGRLIYKDLGYKDVHQFVKVIKRASDPKTPLYGSILEEYKRGKTDYRTMGGLSIFVKNVLGDRSLALHIARDYKVSVLDKLNRDSLRTAENFGFIYEFSDLMTCHDAFFDVCYHQPAEADRLVQRQGWAIAQVKRAITRDELDHKLVADDKPVFNDPDWSVLLDTISQKYPQLDAKKLVLDYEIDYYRHLGDWIRWARCKDERITDYPPRPGGLAVTMELNDGGAWDVFLHCNEESLLLKALDWIDLAVKLEGPGAGYLDTKANLLYKLGKSSAAIACEQEAIDSSTALEVKQRVSKGYYSADYSVALRQMKDQEPTYLRQGAKWAANTLPKKWANRK